MSQKDKRFYILVGDENTWKTSFDKKIWGFSDKTKGSWNTSNVGDLLAFYVTSPVKKIVGFGRIARKFVDENLVWRDEFVFKKAVWKYRLEFESYYVIEDWNNGLSVPHNIMMNQGRKVVEKDLFISLIKEADSKWKNNIQKKIKF